jgi:hypothetical protein
MLTSKSVRLSAGVVAVVALLATTNGCAQSQSTPAVPTFENSPLVAVTARLCFANGCCYNATADLRSNIITSLTTASDTPKATVQPYEECKVVKQPGICERETGLKFCPPVELGRPPIQGRPGGTCFFPPYMQCDC